MTKSASASHGGGDIFAGMFQSVLGDLKASPPLWENVCARATKLSAQLNSMANALATFIDAMQAVSDNANNTKESGTFSGATRDIGAALTRFCLRQKSVERRLRALAAALSGAPDGFAPALERRAGEWRQRVGDADRRRTRALKKCRQRPTAGSTITAAAESRAAFADLLTEQRKQFLHFVTALLPVMDAQLDALDEGAHVREVRDSLAATAADSDSEAIISALLEDAQIHAATNGSRASTDPNSATTAEGLWQRRISSCTADGTLMKSASQYLHCGGSEDAGSLATSDSSSRYGQPASCSSTSSAGGVSDPYGTIHSVSPGIGAPGRRAALAANTFAPPSRPATGPASPSFVERRRGNLGSADSPTLTAGKPPPPARCAPLPAPPSTGRGSMSLSTSDVSSLGPAGTLESVGTPFSGPGSVPGTGPGPVGPGQSLGGETMRRARPLSLTGCEQFPSHARDDVSHRSSNQLIAETLQQIDRLGIELDSYCRTLAPLDERAQETPGSGSNGSIGASTPGVLVRSAQIHTQLQYQQQGTCGTLGVLGVQYQTRTYSGDNASSGLGSGSSGSLDTAQPAVRYRPDPARIPPQPPERRNSTITAATPTAPSIADLRGISGGDALATSQQQQIPQQQMIYRQQGQQQMSQPEQQQSCHLQQKQQCSQQQVSQRKSSQMFDQYNHVPPTFSQQQWDQQRLPQQQYQHQQVLYQQQQWQQQNFPPFQLAGAATTVYHQHQLRSPQDLKGNGQFSEAFSDL